jgi:hypothetical protein
MRPGEAKKRLQINPGEDRAAATGALIKGGEACKLARKISKSRAAVNPDPKTKNRLITIA